MKQKILAVIATLMLGMSTYAHADEMISIKAGYMMLTPSGQFAATVNNTGTQIDLEQDLNFDNSKQFTGEIGISLGDSLFSLAYIPLSFTGDGLLTRPISYNGQTFTAGSTVTNDYGATPKLLSQNWIPMLAIPNHSIEHHNHLSQAGNDSYFFRFSCFH